MLQSRQLFTELPEPLGVLVTEGLRLGSLDSTVRVVEASLSLQTLVHSAEDRGLSPGLGGLQQRPEEEHQVFKDAESVLNMTRELCGDHTRVEAVHIDTSALQPVDKVL